MLIVEKDCPKCKGVMEKRGIFRNEVILSLNEDNIPVFFENEVEDFRTIYLPDEVFFQCENCDYKEVIK